MTALLGLSPAVLFLFVVNMVLFACVVVLFIVYVVRLVARSRAGSIRAGRMNTTLFTVISGVLGTAWISIWGAGYFTNSPLLSQFGYIFMDLFLIYALVMALRWVR